MKAREFLGGAPSPAVSAVDRLGQVRPGWDSYGGAPIDDTVRARARGFITEEEGRPEPAAFLPNIERDGDALSAHLEELVPVEDVLKYMDRKSSLRNFGLCRLSIDDGLTRRY